MSLRRQADPVHLLFVLSGAAGLGYQMVWVKMFAAALGHEMPALISVAGACLGGMAAGAWCADRRIGGSARGGRWYGGLELAIAAWATLSAWLVPAAGRLAMGWTGPAPTAVGQWTVAFLVPLVILLPATAAMGATLPAMDRFLAARTGRTSGVGAWYASNTFGAALGTLAAVFGLMPALGFRASLFSLAGLSLVSGSAALWMSRHDTASGSSIPTVDKAAGAARGQRAPEQADTPWRAWRLGAAALFTGLLGIGFEIVGVRVLSQILENTIYSYAAALTVYLGGTAAGAALHHRFGARHPFGPTLTLLLCGVSASVLGGARLLMLAQPVYLGCRSRLGDGLGAVLCSEMAAAAMVFALPTLLMGATFSHLVQAARGERGGVGRMGSVNTLGCALATAIVGVLLLPGLGSRLSLVALAGGYLLLLPRPRGWAWAMLVLPAGALLTLPAALQIVDRPEGARVEASFEGSMATVAVIRTPDGQRSLRVNNRLQMGGTGPVVAERRQAHLPLLLHPHPRRALFLGPGTGITLGAAGQHPGIAVEGVELVPEILQAMRYFEPENGGPLPKPGIDLHAADARRFLRTTTNRYDVIVADLFHPGQDGAGFLYTREHFEAARARLEPGGLFCQWLPLHQLDETVLRSIIRTFQLTFPASRGLLLHFNVDIPVLGLIGASGGWRLPADWPERLSNDATFRAHLRGAGLEKPLQVLGCLAAGPESLREFAGAAPVGTDDHPVVLFAAPRFTVRHDTRPADLLLTLIARCQADESGFLRSVFGQAEPGLASNLAGFIAARDIYLKGLVEEGAGRLTAAIDAYLESTRRSVHFTPAYARCVTIIQVMANADRERARELFDRLEAAQPAQPLGRKLLAPLLEKAGGAGQ